VAIIILACLFFGIGTQAAAYFAGEPENSAGSAGADRSAGIVPAAFDRLFALGDSSTVPPDTANAPAHKKTENLAAPRGPKPTTEPRVHSASKAIHEAKQKAAKQQAKHEAAEEAKQKAAKQEAIKDAKEASGDPLDVLVLGVDRRPEAAKGSSTRSDTIMLVRVIPATGEVKLLSVPRDLYVEVEPGKQDRINSAYAYGGVDQAKAVMEGLTGIDIDNYVIVDFEGFEKVIDAIGGVRVDVGEGVFPEKWNMGEGMEHLNGYKALKYARYRGTPRADLDRIDHQQLLLAALRRQALRWNTVTKLPGAIKATNENVNTDLGVLQVIPLARALVLNGKDAKMTRAELEGSPTYLRNGEQVLMPDEKANEAILQDFRK
jgi:LCP family protein required for cell wall assembly